MKQNKTINIVVFCLLMMNIILLGSFLLNRCGGERLDEQIEQNETALLPTSTESVTTTTSVDGLEVSDADIEGSEEPEVVLVEYDIELPYYIEVDKTRNVVSIYTTNTEGKYETLVRQMICSTEQVKGKFPDGMYQLSPENRRREWGTMLSHGEPLYAQYCCTISGDFLFHSVPYLTRGDRSSLSEWRYKGLGTSCSGGCIRLTVECAKWIYDNCPPGTPVCIMRSEEYDAELIESLRPPEPVNGWDPTDPDPANPYYQPMYDESTEPKPYVYAPLYDYDFDWAPECTRATRKTTTASEAEEETTTAEDSENTTAADSSAEVTTAGENVTTTTAAPAEQTQTTLANSETTTTAAES